MRKLVSIVIVMVASCRTGTSHAQSCFVEGDVSCCVTAQAQGQLVAAPECPDGHVPYQFLNQGNDNIRGPVPGSPGYAAGAFTGAGWANGGCQYKVWEDCDHWSETKSANCRHFNEPTTGTTCRIETPLWFGLFGLFS